MGISNFTDAEVCMSEDQLLVGNLICCKISALDIE
jgi:hypothetical protein